MANLKLRMTPVFPATVLGSGGIGVSKSNGQWTIQPDWTGLDLETSIPTPSNRQLWTYDTVNQIYTRLSVQALIDNLPAGPDGATGPAGPGYVATSTSSQTIGNSGTKTFTVQSGLAYTAGARVRAADASNPSTNWMEGVVTSYSGTTLVFTADKKLGSGTLTNWTINLTGQPGADGAGAGDMLAANNLSDLASKKTGYDTISIHGSDVPSASTIDLDAATGNLIDVTGTTTITAITLADGRMRTVRFTGALTLTNGASLVLPGGQNITTAAGDTAIFRGYAAGVIRCVVYVRKDGHPLISRQATIASAATTDLGSDIAENITVSGTTTITSFGSTAPLGATKFLYFSGALILTHNGTSLIIPGAANITTAAGDCAIVRHESSGNWRVLSYLKAALSPVKLLTWGKQTIWIPAVAMIARTTNGAESGSAEMATNKQMFKTLDFDTSTQEFAQFAIHMPKSWDEGTVTFQPVWSHAATATNFGVVWALEALALSDDDAGDASFGTAQTSTDTGGTTNDIYIGPESSEITIGGSPAENDYVIFQVKRVPSNGSDTMAIDARLHGIKLFITTNAATDA